MLNKSDHRNGSTVKDQNNLIQVGSINMVNSDLIMSACDMIPSAYLQKTYPSNNIYVWLSTFLVVRSIDPALAHSM